ncbi:hypothetical protein EJB05_36042, partial [Eragrostis curvula]
MATASDTSAAAASTACEVVEGARDSALRLLDLLQAMGADPGRQKLAEQIIRSIDRALAAVRGDKKKRSRSAYRPDPQGQSKRRAMCGRGETGARVVSATTDDGFAWRKYGEKVINHRSYPRFYFRCTYRDEHGCSAKKQVQQRRRAHPCSRPPTLGEHTPACPRDAPLAVANCAFVSQAHFPHQLQPGRQHILGRRGAAGAELCRRRRRRRWCYRTWQNSRRSTGHWTIGR